MEIANLLTCVFLFLSGVGMIVLGYYGVFKTPNLIDTHIKLMSGIGGKTNPLVKLLIKIIDNKWNVLNVRFISIIWILVGALFIVLGYIRYKHPYYEQHFTASGNHIRAIIGPLTNNIKGLLFKHSTPLHFSITHLFTGAF